MDEVEALRQQLRDEAAWRGFVEGRLARESEKAAVWRQRAEARAARIQELSRARPVRRVVAMRLARAMSDRPDVRLPPDDSTAKLVATSVLRPSGAGALPRRPRHPDIRVATLLGDHANEVLATEFDPVQFSELEGRVGDVDLGLFDDRGWQESPELHGRAIEWLSATIRPPIAWLGDRVPDGVKPYLDVRDLVTSKSAGPFRSMELAPWATDTPSLSVPRVGAVGRFVMDNGIRLLADATGPLLGVVSREVPPGRILGLALAGIPAIDKGGEAILGLPSTSAPIDVDFLERGGQVGGAVRRLAILQRRHVAQTATPGQRATELLQELDIPNAYRASRLAILLSSNRPEFVPAVLQNLSQQTRSPDEVILGIHGAPSSSGRQRILAEIDKLEFPVSVSTFPSAISLGRVLNELNSTASSEIVAKLDDDDHYGKSHLLDAEISLNLSRADIVGKAAHYVYSKARDTTWLVSSHQEDVPLQRGVMGATLVMHRGVLSTIPFPDRARRVDSIFVRAAARCGAMIHAMPANDFAYIKHDHHQTNVAGLDFLDGVGTRVGNGLRLDEIDI